MKNISIRLIGCLLILCILSGCGAAVTPTENTEASATEFKGTETTGTETVVPDPTDAGSTESTGTGSGVQETTGSGSAAPSLSMPENELKAALLQLEYAMLPFNAGICDFDKDGNAELFCGDIGLVFDVADNRSMTFYYSQNGIVFYTDKSGNVYLCDSFGGGYFDEEEGIFMEGYDMWFSAYQNGQWETVLSTGYSLTETYTWNDEAQEWVSDQREEISDYKIAGVEVSQDAYNDHIQDIGLTKDFPIQGLYCDSVYADSLFAALEARLQEAYSLTTLRKDVDGDGLEEMVFAASDLWAPWRNNVHRNVEDGWGDTAEEVMQWGVPLDQLHTGILIADIGPEMVIFTAYDVIGDVKLTQDTQIYYGFGQIQIDGVPMETYEYIPY